jgi:RNA polymerase sigma-70 factor (ECF subfamily)
VRNNGRLIECEATASDAPLYGVLDDSNLVALTLDGQSGAFDELVRRYADKVHGLAYKVLRHDEDAEDALQDTFLSVYRNLPRFEGKSSFSTWLYRVAMNAALMRLRKRREGMVSLDQPIEREDGSYLQQLAHSGRSPIEELVNDELRDALERAVDSLPGDLAEVFLLRQVDGLSNADLASMYGISIPAVKSRLHRARLALRDRLARYLAGRKDRQAARPARRRTVRHADGRPRDTRTRMFPDMGTLQPA